MGIFQKLRGLYINKPTLKDGQEYVATDRRALYTGITDSDDIVNPDIEIGTTDGQVPVWSISNNKYITSQNVPYALTASYAENSGTSKLEYKLTTTASGEYTLVDSNNLTFPVTTGYYYYNINTVAFDQSFNSSIWEIKGGIYYDSASAVVRLTDSPIVNNIYMTGSFLIDDVYLYDNTVSGTLDIVVKGQDYNGINWKSTLEYIAIDYAPVIT